MTAPLTAPPTWDVQAAVLPGAWLARSRYFGSDAEVDDFAIGENGYGSE